MAAQNKRIDDFNLNLPRKETEKRTGLSTATGSTDIVRRRAKALEAIEKSQREAEVERKEQIATRENKDTSFPDSPSTITEEYKDIRANALKAAESRRE